jgi:hypothetical protein
MKIDYVERSVYGFFGELKFEGVFFAKVKFDDEKDSCRLW